MSTPAEEPPDGEKPAEVVDPSEAAEHALFWQSVYCFDQPPPKQSPQQVLVALLLSAALFVGAAYLQSPDLFLTLLLVVFIHELGHYAAMKAFGYRNVKLVFVPFFGGAVIGEKITARAWQQLIMLLLGPLPGMLLAVGLFVAFRPAPDTWLERLILVLLGVNALNLLPLVPLDGGRVVEILLFARHPVLTVAFRVLAILGLGALAWAAESVILGGVAVLVAVGIPAAYRYGVAARQFRAAQGKEGLPDTLDAVDEEGKWSLFQWARIAAPGASNPWIIAGVMKRLYAESVAGVHAGWGTTVAAFVAYLGGFAVVVLFSFLYHTFAPEADVRAGRELVQPHLDRIGHLNQTFQTGELVTSLDDLGKTWAALRPPVREALLDEYLHNAATWPPEQIQAFVYLQIYGRQSVPPAVTLREDGMIQITPPDPVDQRGP